MTALSPRLYADLIGKPFATDARGPSAYDCLGLALELTRRRGIAVPEYASTPAEFHAHYHHAEGVLGPCERIERPEPGCVVLMRSPESPADRHLGVMVDCFRMLHASEDAGQVVLENLLRSFWGRRVLGYYLPEERPA